MIPSYQPQYQFNLGQSDPLLSNLNGQGGNLVDEIDNRIVEMQMMKQQIVEGTRNSPNTNNSQSHNRSQVKQITLFDEINTEVSALTKSQKEILFNDKEYSNNEYAIQNLVQEELINLVKLKLQNTPKGKELLEKQLALVKDKKTQIVEENDKQMELFKKFQIAAQANPNLSYAEFVKSFNQ